MDEFPNAYDLQTLNLAEINNLYTFITSHEMDYVIKSLPTKKRQGQ